MMDSIEQMFDPDKAMVVTADTRAPAEVTWPLLCTPGWWPSWAPHIRQVTGGDRRTPPPSELEVGQRIALHGPPPLRVKATICRVDPGERWDMLLDPLGPWRIRTGHLVQPLDGMHSRITIGILADGPLTDRSRLSPLLAYLPLARLSVHRLAALAARDHAAARAANQRLDQP